MPLIKWTRERFALMTTFEARNVTGAGFTTEYGTFVDAGAVLIEKLDQEPFFCVEWALNQDNIGKYPTLTDAKRAAVAKDKDPARLMD